MAQDHISEPAVMQPAAVETGAFQPTGDGLLAVLQDFTDSGDIHAFHGHVHG